MVCLSISLELLRVVQWRGDVNSDSDACHRTSIGNDGHDFSKKRACAAGVPLLPYRDFHPVTCCILFLFIIHNSTCTRLNVRQSKLHSMSSAPEFVYFHSLSVIHRYRIFQFRPKTNVRHPKSPNVRPNTNVREGFVFARTFGHFTERLAISASKVLPPVTGLSQFMHFQCRNCQTFVKMAECTAKTNIL